ncbi:MAG TPA: protein-methionine-sulfoxide reductase catalytic subunit MsrP [Gammaproteobacteria bacterium]|jgi:sulfoxide reductase catalytic subunit YedY|nr:protein-methionine-sulfoxide reductase catalytic subunit MsrP [Gammaproteobacteria bacterium]
MLIKRARAGDIRSSEITSETVFHERRQIIKAMGLGAVALGTPVVGGATSGERQFYTTQAPLSGPAWLQNKLKTLTPGQYSTRESATPFEYVSTYNNFYEFGTGKTDPADNSQNFVTDPWKVEVAGEAELTGTYNLEDIVNLHTLEERVYRLRCVEAWSMVVPWVGFPLANLLKRFKPNSNAKYVRFETLHDPEQMPAQGSRFAAIDYPYIEGLRIDEAMNELAFLAVGVYGNAMPNQNGAPIRLVVPWKYGFKSIKSIVKIEFTKRRPKTTWEISNSREYGFYANVNPDVDHPRWSQARERRLPTSIFSQNYVETLKFNGYAPLVAHLYKDMDLRKQY